MFGSKLFTVKTSRSELVSDHLTDCEADVKTFTYRQQTTDNCVMFLIHTEQCTQARYYQQHSDVCSTVVSCSELYFRSSIALVLTSVSNYSNQSGLPSSWRQTDNKCAFLVMFVYLVVCSCDLDLHPMTLTYKHDLNTVVFACLFCKMSESDFRQTL